MTDLLARDSDELQLPHNTTEATYDAEYRLLAQRRDAASWQALRHFFSHAEAGEVGTIRNGAETLLEFTANEDGSVTVREIAG